MDQEILTPDEFAQKLKIGRSTLFEWIRDGVLVADLHFVKVGRIVRFYWSDNVLFTLKKPQIQQSIKLRTVRNRKQQQSSIDWEY